MRMEEGREHGQTGKHGRLKVDPWAPEGELASRF